MGVGENLSLKGKPCLYVKDCQSRGHKQTDPHFSGISDETLN